MFADCEIALQKYQRQSRLPPLSEALYLFFLPKPLSALFVEGSFEKVFYGQIQWGAMGFNVLVPPLLMVAAGLMD